MLRNIEERNDSEYDIGKLLAGLKKLGISVEKPVDLVKLLPKDDYEDSLEIMAQVRAYFHGLCLIEFPSHLS